MPTAVAVEPVHPPRFWRRRRTDVLTGFGTLVVAVMLLALGTASLLSFDVFQTERVASLRGSAPALLGLIREHIVATLRRNPDDALRVLNELTRLPHVQGLTLTPPAEAGTAVAPPGGSDARRVLAARGEARTPVALSLRSELVEHGTHFGTLAVDFGFSASAGASAVFWSTIGLVTVTALGAFALLYRGMLQRIRPIAAVRDNLLAFEHGVERSLELLAVQDARAHETQAWNRLVGTIADLQTELEAYRARQVVADSAHVLLNQSSRSVLDALPSGVLRLDRSDRVRYANYSAQQLLGVAPGADDAPLAERVSDAKLVDAIRGLRSTPQGASIDYAIGHDGQSSVVRMTVIPVRATDDDELNVIVQDISQLKEAERSREEFLAHITHELRTPLTNIRAYAETLNEDFFADEHTRRECYNVIMSETRRLAKLVEDVLSASQIDAGVARLDRTAVRLDQSLRKAVQEIQAAADAKSIELALKIPSKPPGVNGDKFRLHQVWINLIGNAIKYTPSGGSVTVELSGADHLSIVRVSDTGIGIAPEHHDKVFEKFFRVHDPRVAAEEGTGLGLAITREIVRLHGGSLKLESDAGKGSTFIVELPRLRNVDAEPVRAGAATGRERE
ncbi:MAG: sensor histidine kinase [Phycisphaerae bacterium]